MLLIRQGLNLKRRYLWVPQYKFPLFANCVQMARKKRVHWEIHVTDKKDGLRLLSDSEAQAFLGYTSAGPEPEPCYPKSDVGHAYEEIDLSPRQRLWGVACETLRRIWVSPDGREAHFVQQSCNLETGEANRNRFIFLGMRVVKYADKKCLLSWCSSPECKRQCQEIAARFQLTDSPQLQSCKHTSGISLHCPLSEIAVEIASSQMKSPLDLEAVFRAGVSAEVKLSKCLATSVGVEVPPCLYASSALTSCPASCWQLLISNPLRIRLRWISSRATL